METFFFCVLIARPSTSKRLWLAASSTLPEEELSPPTHPPHGSNAATGPVPVIERLAQETDDDRDLTDHCDNDIAESLSASARKSEENEGFCGRIAVNLELIRFVLHLKRMHTKMKLHLVNRQDYPYSHMDLCKQLVSRSIK